jgi:molybdate/tungstate transport system substrate-binding protein
MSMVRRQLRTLGVLPACLLGAAGLAVHPAALTAAPAAERSPERSVSVLYAGSLAAVMENGVGPAFVRATGYGYQGEAQGSLGAAQMIRDRVRTPDVFISSDPAVNERVLMGPGNGSLVRWFTIVASAQLVLAYNPRSRFAAQFEQARTGRVPWYEVLETPGVRFGRGDPTIDPKGYRTLFLFRLAGPHYHRPEIPAFLGDPRNPVQVFPEIVLLARLETGQLDAGVFYKHEVVAHRLPYISLPPEINQGALERSALYARESYTTPSGQHVTGSPILFTVTIPETVRHRQAALTFVRFLLASDALLREFGFGSVPHQVRGETAQFPAELRDLGMRSSRP